MVIIRIARGGAGGGCGEANTISSLGCGLGLTATVDKVGIDLRVRSLAAGAGISIGEAADLITITNTGGCGCGESNTISSVGCGSSSLVACPSKVGVDLRTKSLSVSCPITKTDCANLITLDLANLPVLGTNPASARPTCITNAEIIAAAGIPYSKLTFANNIVAGDIAACAIGSSELANCSVDIAAIQDNAVTLAKMAGGTDGNLITYDACGNPAFVATGTACQVLTSNGAGAAPTFQAGGGGAGKTHAVLVRNTEACFITCCTTLANDDVLSFAVAANRTYALQVNAVYISSAVGKMKMAFTIPTNATMNRGTTNIYYRGQTGTEFTANGTTAADYGGAACQRQNSWEAIIAVGACAGCVNLQWAQQVSNGCNTRMRRGASMVVWENCA